MRSLGVTAALVCLWAGVVAAEAAPPAPPCPCARPEWCLPVKTPPRKEARAVSLSVFVFAVKNDTWKHYDWDKVTTVVMFGFYSAELMCYAHSKGARVVLKGDVKAEDVPNLTKPLFRDDWVINNVALMLKQHMDGINIDIEQPIPATDPARDGLTALVNETTWVFHAINNASQVTFDVAWSPDCIDGRCYDIVNIAKSCDFLFVMSYDERSQITGPCVASANSALETTLGDKPWITPAIKDMIRKRQQAFHSRTEDVWKRLRNKVIRDIKLAKKKHYVDKIQQLKVENPATWYKELKTMCNIVKPPCVIHVPDVDPTDHKAVADAINKHLASISQQSPPVCTSQLPAYLPAPSPPPQIQPWDMYAELRRVKVGKAGGPDGIAPRLVRMFACELAEPLTDILNTSLKEGVVPTQWKEAVVAPIPKELPAVIDKLRPISLTAIFAKICEGFVAKWVLWDIWKNIDQRYEEYLKLGVPADQLVMGVPWYGYDYPCLQLAKDDVCSIKKVPFRGVPCSDAAGRQVDYKDIMKLMRNSTRRWNDTFKSPYFNFQEGGQTHQMWFDDPVSLQYKYGWAVKQGLRGVGMWHGDTLDYTTSDPKVKEQTKQMWDCLPQYHKKT
ncbi:CTBS [Branchiostoma lanceolatum]|uniref:CTBS protein n=1 Tax=Branchiostoma lanceolatum TaxID=7740 RepID=A0A8J9YQW3_BRALA|nr:CTBS [Branchiostoma lanceolatum]